MPTAAVYNSQVENINEVAHIPACLSEPFARSKPDFGIGSEGPPITCCSGQSNAGYFLGAEVTPQ